MRVEPGSWGVLSTDVPGAFGDASGGLDPGGEPPGAGPGAGPALSAPFGGTSAACAIAAGVASPIRAGRRRRGRPPMTGPEMKRHFRPHGPVATHGPDGAPVPRVDARARLDAL